MKTLNLEQAAAFLHMHRYTVMQKVNAGEIPGAKPGKRWVFIEDDLAAYLRGQYREAADGLVTTNPQTVSHLKQSQFRKIDEDYARLLGLPNVHKSIARSQPRGVAQATHTQRDGARSEAVELVGISTTVAQSPVRMAQGDRR